VSAFFWACGVPPHSKENPVSIVSGFGPFSFSGSCLPALPGIILVDQSRYRVLHEALAALATGAAFSLAEILPHDFIFIIPDINPDGFHFMVFS
jgi:hypothetical protein